MSTFEQYLVYESEEDYGQKQLKIMDKINISSENEEKIKSISKEINILSVAEVFCPDCRAIVPFLEKFSKINDKIKVKYSKREDVSDLLIQKTGVAKLPTLFYNDGEKLQLMLLELPKIVLDDMEKNKENYDEIKYNFRTGKYNNEIEKELVDYLTNL